MTNKKSTKRALLASLLAMLLCVTMLVGTTFAWFTDSVTSSGNIIKSGTLDVELYLGDGTGKYVEITGSSDPVFGTKNGLAQNVNDDTLWEPGKTQVAYFKIVNAGSLDFKYQVALTVSDPDGAKMYEVMQYAIVPDATVSVDEWEKIADKQIPQLGVEIVTTDVPLEADAEHYFALVIHMNEDAGNEYQDKDIVFDITVLATQLASEEDSFGPDYDKDAKYPVHYAGNAAGFELALENAAPGDTIKLTEGVDFGTLEIDGELTDVTIEGGENANAKFNILPTAVLENVTFTDLDVYNVTTSGAYVDGGVINVDAGATVKNLVIENSVLEGEGGRSCIIGCSEPTAQITLKDCDISGTKYLFYGSAPIDVLTVEGCTISNLSSWAILGNAADGIGANLTINDCDFINCTDGIAKYLGSAQPEGSTTVFTNNTLDADCKGHDGSDAKWFTIPGAADTITVSGNTLDGSEWIPGVAQGLGK